MDNKSVVRILPKPLIVRKGTIRILNHSLINEKPFTPEDLCREDVLYDTSDMYFLKGEYQRLLLVNRFNIITKQSRAVAKYFSKDGSVIEKTSDRVTEVIGQEQFKTIFTAICSILDQELKIRSILALLTFKATDTKIKIERIDNNIDRKKSPMKLIDRFSQTDEMRIDKVKPKKRIRKPISPYIVQDAETEKRKRMISLHVTSKQNVESDKKKPKKLMIEVNHINPDTLEKITLSSGTSAVSSDHEDTGCYDPFNSNQKTQTSITDANNQNVNSSSLTNLEEQNYILPDMNTQTHNSADSLTDLDTRKNNSIGNLIELDAQKNNSIGTLTGSDGQKNNSIGTLTGSDGQKNNSIGTLTGSDGQKNNSIGNLIELDAQKNNSIGTLTGSDGQKNNSIGTLTGSDGQKHNSIGNLTDLGFLHDDFSNDSTGRLSVLSDTPTDPELLTNPGSLLDNIDQHTKEYAVCAGYTVPGTDIIVPYKPEDIFHIATKENLQYLDKATKTKLLMYQLMIDQENCLTLKDEDGNLPIHLAVMNNDAELLTRQCIVLKKQGGSVDVLANGLTALKIAVATGRGALAACLVRHGACPLRTDDAHRTCLHDAAEKDADVLRAVLAVCRENARKILYENEDLWKPEMEKQSDEELAQQLLNHICSMFNKQGYNPVMLASMLGLYENVRILLEHSANVNDRMPTCGNTALYLACAAACNSSIELGNKSKVVDHFRKTIELILQNGADPSIENNYGTNVHILLQEFNNQELCMLIGNTHYLQLLKKDAAEKDAAKIMLVLEKDGIKCKALENERTKKRNVKVVKKSTDKKLVVVENVILKTGNTATSAGKRKVEPKVNSKNLKVFQIQNSGQKIENKKVAILPAVTKNHGVKRKQSDKAPNVIKQAKNK